MKETITPRELKKLFLIFLKENNALEAYKKAIINDCEKRNLSLTLAEKINIFSIRDIKRLINGERYTMLISSAFIWSNTQEGHYYWETLNIKWKQLYAKTTMPMKPKPL